MLGTTFHEYILIRLAILALQYTTPLCLLALALLLLGGGQSALASSLRTALISFSLIDIAYALFIYYPYNRRLKEEARQPPPLSRAERRAIFKRCFAHIPDVERYVRLWFLGADLTEIRRENLADFILWAFFDRAPGQESQEDLAELNDYIDIIGDRLGRKVEPGRGKAEGLRLTLNEVETRYRSCLWILIIGLVDTYTHCRLACSGFQYYAQPRSTAFSVVPLRLQSLFARHRSRSRELAYWYRPHTAKGKLPVVFLHGIGIGLYTYVPWLAKMKPPVNEDGQIGVIALELLPVSFRLTKAPLEKLEFLSQVEEILETHGWDRFVLATHSYGSFLGTHMIKSKTIGYRIESVVLIDPVSIMLHLPDVAFNFTRRKPRKANEWQLWYFASMDPGVAHALGRHFFWKENIIWKEELLARGGSKQRRVAVCLSERDLIVDTITIAEYLAGEEDWERHLMKDGIEVFWSPGLDHAQVFEKKADEDRMASVVTRYCIE
ncbi:uncharacterized protein BCR38DRAFT_385135 [Pseudomassariella vexata]|uniref:AB hydrolase-1 domain-containing protein n=1 Tax=Pseudomassariella vexata TaxID=1141098 RepID=A0A1Y2EFC3_9PEZI|nr:uncharacterized protein BCR38DRAFT_385135 [Pseudomassariella vexata]ORY70283.1 hypothetical protein BCR38DRAFT_385135 [Pseudomassariella vexata]